MSTFLICFAVYYVATCWLAIHLWRKNYDITVGILLACVGLFWIASPVMGLMHFVMNSESVVLKKYKGKQC